MVSNDEFRKLIHTLNNNYVHWDKFMNMQLPDGITHKEIWELACFERKHGYPHELTFENIHLFWWIGNSIEAQLHQLDVGLAGGRKMEALTISKHIHRHRTNALLDESIASAQLAGINVSKKAAKEMLLKKRPPQNGNEQICINIFKTSQLALLKKDDTLDEDLLFLIHQTLTKDTIKPKGIGQYRSNQKTDRSLIDLSAKYKQPDAGKVPSLMKLVIAFYNQDATPFFIHPLIKAAILHYLILYIRPFKDGNGRMARLLANMFLLKQGYWVSEFLSVSNTIIKFKQQYNKTITQSQLDNNNIGYFIHFYIQSVQMAYRSLQDFVNRISKESVDKKGVRYDGYNERQTAVIKWLKEDPEKRVSIRELRSVYGVSKETARTDLNGLVEKGWIKFYPINKKAYAFVRAEGFDELMVQYG